MPPLFNRTRMTPRQQPPNSMSVNHDVVLIPSRPHPDDNIPFSPPSFPITPSESLTIPPMPPRPSDLITCSTCCAAPRNCSQPQETTSVTRPCSRRRSMQQATTLVSVPVATAVSPPSCSRTAPPTSTTSTPSPPASPSVPRHRHRPSTPRQCPRRALIQNTGVEVQRRSARTAAQSGLDPNCSNTCSDCCRSDWNMTTQMWHCKLNPT